MEQVAFVRKIPTWTALVIFLIISSFIFDQGYVSEDSTLYGVLGIVSVVGVVVCTLLDEDIFVSWKYMIKVTDTHFSDQLLISVHDYFILARNGTNSMAYNVWGTYFFIYHACQISACCWVLFVPTFNNFRAIGVGPIIGYCSTFNRFGDWLVSKIPFVNIDMLHVSFIWNDTGNWWLSFRACFTFHVKIFFELITCIGYCRFFQSRSKVSLEVRQH